MDIDMWLAAPAVSVAMMTLAEVNARLVNRGLSISYEDARMLATSRAEALFETERVEFGEPAIAEIAEAIATSPCLAQDSVADTLVELQRTFYAIRDELPVDVSDTEIAEALRGCLDEWGDAAMVAMMPADEVMSFSAEYVRTNASEELEEYCIVDDEGRAYTFNPIEWDYDEQAEGWNGERWADGWDDEQA